MAESPLDSCANCWHRDYHHRGSCTGAGLHLRWARFLQVRCQCERFVSARAIIADLQRQLQQVQEGRDKWKASRIFYQDIVYAVCNELDKAFGYGPARGVVVKEAAQATARLRTERDAAIKRAEAAETALAEQRALCKRWRNR